VQILKKIQQAGELPMMKVFKHPDDLFNMGEYSG